MPKNQRDRRDTRLEPFDRRKFEQEVAEEIGVSLDRALGRANRRAGNAASPPAAEKSRPGPGGRRAGPGGEKTPGL